MPQGADENWLKVKTCKLPKARENAGDQVVIALSFESDWLRGWRWCFGPILKGIYATPKQSRMTFDAHLKISLY